MTNQQKQIFLTTLERFYDGSIIKDELSKKENDLWAFLHSDLNLTAKQSATISDLLFDVFEIVKWKYFEFGEMASEMFDGLDENSNPLDKFKNEYITA